MQNTAFAVSPSLTLNKPRKLFDFSRVSLSASSSKSNESFSISSSSSFHCRCLSVAPSSSSSSSSLFTGYSSASDATRFETRATYVRKSAAEVSNAFLKTLQLGSLFGLWYLFNIYFNIYNKQVLKVSCFSLTAAAIPFGVEAKRVLFSCAFNLYKRPKISGSLLAATLPSAMAHTLEHLFINVSLGKVAVSFTHTIKAMGPFSVVLSAILLGELAVTLPSAMAHTLGHLFTNMSLGKVAVSFTHTIKAMGPFFSVVLSAILLGEIPTALVVPIVGGLALASVTAALFNRAEFESAMASTLTFQSHNVRSKKVMVNKEGINVKQLYTVALCLHAYQQETKREGKVRKKSQKQRKLSLKKQRSPKQRKPRNQGKRNKTE